MMSCTSKAKKDTEICQSISPRDSFGTSLRRLQSLAPDCISLERDTVRATVGCDALDLLAALDSKDTTRAVRLYRGAFLQGLDLTLGEELEEWVYGTREQLAARVRLVLLDLAERALAAGDKHEAAKRAEAALSLAGAPELEPSLIGRLYRLLRLSGSALAGDVLNEVEALGLSLPVDLAGVTELEEAAEKQEMQTNPFRLPVTTTSFVGRHEEITTISRWLSEPHCRLLTLHGPGGVGKSRLALQVAQDCLDRGDFPGGVSFVPLEALSKLERKCLPPSPKH